LHDDVLPTTEYVPFPHAWHAVAPEDDTNDPVEQTVHTLDPLLGENVPAGHMLHANELFALEKKPFGHTRQPLLADREQFLLT
jgi:hypothetical protein